MKSGALRPMRVVVLTAVLAGVAGMVFAGDFARMKFNNPGLVVDAKSKSGLATGQLLLRDLNRDGLMDIVVNGGWGRQWNGNESFAFMNPGPKGDADPLFAPPTFLGKGSFDDGLRPLRANGKPLTVRHFRRKVRDFSRQLVDYDGDGVDDCVVCYGDWSLYGWDNAYDARGCWTNSTLHGYVYWCRGLGNGRFAKEEVLRLEDGNYLDAFGGCSVLFSDWDGDGKLDLVMNGGPNAEVWLQQARSGETWRFDAPVSVGANLVLSQHDPQPTACDFNGDGVPDLVMGAEDGFFYYFRNPRQ